MINKINNISIEKKYAMTLFIFFLIICLLVPLNGDDWGNFNPNVTISWSLSNALESYKTYEGRIFSRFFVNFGPYYKTLWAFCNSFLISLIYIFFKKIYKNTKCLKQLLLLGLLALLCVNYNMFSQEYVWVTGNITYLVPCALLVIYFIYLFYSYKKISKYNFLPLILVNISCPLFVEHIGGALLVGNLLFLIYQFIFKHKISKFNIILLILSLVSVLISYYSPGSANRINNSLAFSNLNILGKIRFNFHNFINYTYLFNPFLIFLMTIPINYFIYKIIKKNISFLILIIFNIIPVFTIISNFHLFYPFNEYQYSMDLVCKQNEINCTNWSYYFWIIYTILFFISIVFIIPNKKEKIKYLILTIIGYSANLTMLLSPTWGARTSYFTYIWLSFISIGLISFILKYKDDIILKKLNKILTLFVVCLFTYYIISFSIIKHFDNIRLNQISKQIGEGKTELVVKTLPIKLVWNYNPNMEFHQESYIKYLYYQGIIKKGKIIQL
jgi:hypothetical protein